MSIAAVDCREGMASLPAVAGRNRRPCPGCGRSMDRQSTKCRDCYIAETSSPDSYLKVVCGGCDRPFEVHKGQIEAGGGRFCSRRCARKGNTNAKTNRVELPCGHCGEPLLRSKSTIGATGAAFCGPRCWSLHSKGENNPNWSGGQHVRMNPEGTAWREAVRKRDGGRCRLCGSTRNLEAHHILPFRRHKEERWMLAFGVLLCRKHHRAMGRNEMEHAPALLALIAPKPVMVCKEVVRGSRD